MGYDDLLDNQSFMRGTSAPTNGPNTPMHLAADVTPPQPSPRIGSMPQHHKLREFNFGALRPLPGWPKVAPPPRGPSGVEEGHFMFGDPAQHHAQMVAEQAFRQGQANAAEIRARHAPVMPAQRQAPVATGNGFQAPGAPAGRPNPSQMSPEEQARYAASLDPGWHAHQSSGHASGAPSNFASRAMLSLGAPEPQAAQPVPHQVRGNPMAVHRMPPPPVQSARADFGQILPPAFAAQPPQMAPASEQQAPAIPPNLPKLPVREDMIPASHAAPEARPALLDEMFARKKVEDAYRERLMHQGSGRTGEFVANVLNPILGAISHDKMANDSLEENSKQLNDNRLREREMGLQAAGQQGSADHEALAAYEHLDPASMYNRKIQAALEHNDIIEATKLHFEQRKMINDQEHLRLENQRLKLLEQGNADKVTIAEHKSKIDELGMEIKKLQAENQGKHWTNQEADTRRGQDFSHQDRGADRTSRETEGEKNRQSREDIVDTQQRGANNRTTLTSGAALTNAANKMAHQREQDLIINANKARQVNPKTGQPMYGADAAFRAARPWSDADTPKLHAVMAQFKLDPSKKEDMAVAKQKLLDMFNIAVDKK